MNARPRSEPTLLGVLATSERMALGVVSWRVVHMPIGICSQRRDACCARQISAHLT